MISTYWIEKRKPYWSRLEQLLDRSASKGLRFLSRAELQDLSLLYRQTAADLAAVGEDPSSLHYSRYLAQLLARAHHTIYSRRQVSAVSAIRSFYIAYPRIFRQNLSYTLAAFLVFLGLAVIGSLLTLQSPTFELQILGQRMVETIERREMWTHSIVAIKPIASSTIMTNNIGVAFTAFAAGITAGMGTLYMMAFNGLLIGVIGTACWLSGMSVNLWSFVAPHGVLELPAIFIAGGAGLRLAAAFLFPGVLPRKQSVARGGLEAVQLVLGTIPMLLVAGIIEAFFSPTAVSDPLKFAFAAALFALLNLYLW